MHPDSMSEQTPEQRLAQLGLERERVLAEVKARQSEERPKALASALRLIQTYNLTCKELESGWRKREYKARGPKKPKTATPPAGLNAGVTSGIMSSIPQLAHLGVAA